MMKKFVLVPALALALGAGAALAEEDSKKIEDIAFTFEGPFGTYDKLQLQRGLQIYTESCAACHGLNYVPVRTLADEGGPALPADQVRAYAETILPPIIERDSGEERPRLPTDNFPASSLPNAPDLSLMAKARAGFHGPYGTGLAQLFKGMGGPEYIYAILTGFTGEEKEELGAVTYQNKVFPGGWIAMPPPLADGAVEFADGSPNDLQSLSKDVAAFLMWTAEPKLVARKEAGFQAVLFLTAIAVLLYLVNKRLWLPVKRRSKGAAGG